MTAADTGGARSSPWYPRDADRIIRHDLRSIVGACGPELDRLAGKAILITGGTGFVGRYLVESILHHESLVGERCLLGLLTRDPGPRS